MIILVFWFLLSEHKSFNFATLPVTPSVNEEPEIILKPVLKQVPKKVDTLNTQNNLASISDINLALLGQDSGQNLHLSTAKSGDILQVLMLTESAVNNDKLEANPEKPVLISTTKQVTAKQINTNDVKQEKRSALTGLPVTLNEQYYLNSENGYVVQIRGFSDLLKLKAFVKKNKDQEYFSYQKNLNTKQFFALTSKIFSDKAQAREAMNKLPQAVKNLGFFLKSVSTIKREINTVSQ